MLTNKSDKNSQSKKQNTKKLRKLEEKDQNQHVMVIGKKTVAV